MEKDVLHVTTPAKTHGVRGGGLRPVNSLEKPESVNSVINSLSTIKEHYRRAWGGEVTALGWYSMAMGMPFQQKTNPSFHFSFASSKTKCDF